MESRGVSSIRYRYIYMTWPKTYGKAVFWNARCNNRRKSHELAMPGAKKKNYGKAKCLQ